MGGLSIFVVHSKSCHVCEVKSNIKQLFFKTVFCKGQLRFVDQYLHVEKLDHLKTF